MKNVDNVQSLTIVAKLSILDICGGAGYAFEYFFFISMMMMEQY